MKQLYDIAEKNNISVHNFKMRSAKAVSLPGKIAIDETKVQNSSEFNVCLAHELGHQFKNAFYDISSTLETRERQENRAIRWAVEKLVPLEKLIKAFQSGNTEIYDLAEYFDVTEEFIQDVIRIYEAKGALKAEEELYLFY